MPRTPDSLPDDVEALKAALIETRAKLSGATALIEHLQLVIAKMKREHFGPRSERSQRLLDQMELQLEELAAAAGEDEVEAERRCTSTRPIAPPSIPSGILPDTAAFSRPMPMRGSTRSINPTGRRVRSRK